ncbi:MAG: VCBS repeat-containing protein, partial [Nocardioides sp.]|nr:VCBS repeat-containing protein [Nocardioides sp.]
AISASAQLGLGRWNADGSPDTMFRVGNTIRWYAGNGPGGLTGAFGTLKGNLARFDWVISPGDVDGDGRSDLIVRGRAGGLLWVLPGNAKGFGRPKFLAQGFGGYDLAG